MPKYKVRLMRPVFQVTEVIVDADNTADAAHAAVREGSARPASAWIGEFDPEKYTYDVQACDAFNNNGGDACHDEEHFSTSDDIQYALLRADTSIGEGNLLPQPWMDNPSDPLVLDLAQDWHVDISQLAEKSMDEFYGALETLRPENVIAFPWWRKT